MNSPKPLELSRFTLFSLLYFGCAAIALFMCTPAFVVLMTQDWKFTEAAAGGIVGAAVAGTTTGAFLASIPLKGISRRTLLVAAGVLTVLGYGLPMLGGTPNVIGAELALAGVGGGILSAEALRALTYSIHPHKYLAWNAMLQNLSAALLMGLMLPEISESWGIRGGFFLLTLLAAPCILMCRSIPIPPREIEQAGKGKTNGWGVAALLFSTLTFYILIGVVWTFVGSLGTSHGLKSEDVDRVAGLSNVISLLVCLAAPRLERSRRTRGWSIFSVFGTIAGVLGMAYSPQLLPFAFSFIFMNSAWTLNAIVVQSLFPSVDPRGRFAGLTAGLLGLGYFIGSSVGGSYLADHSAASVFAGASILGVIAGLVLLLVPKAKETAEERTEHALEPQSSTAV